MRVTLWIAIILFLACESKKNTLTPIPKPPTKQNTDTCRISRIIFPFDETLEYTYSNKRISKITLKAQNHEYVTTAQYDASGRLVSLSGPVVDCTYEYDQQDKVIKENRVIHFEIPRGQGHYEARIFEYNPMGLMVKCSYVEGVDHGLNTNFIPKGRIFAYETYEYSSPGNISKMSEYYTNHPYAGFSIGRQWEFKYDDKINPFFGHPGLMDYGIFFGAEFGSPYLVCSKNNLTGGKLKGQPGFATLYQYNNANYPSVGSDVFWAHDFVRPVLFEYENCKN